MLDNGEGQALGHYTEDLRSAFRSAYAIFDKVGLFLNDYFQIGLEPGKVSFAGYGLKSRVARFLKFVRYSGVIAIGHYEVCISCQRICLTKTSKKSRNRCGRSSEITTPGGTSLSEFPALHYGAEYRHA